MSLTHHLLSFLALAPLALAVDGQGPFVWTGRGGPVVHRSEPGSLALGYGGLSTWWRIRPDEHVSGLRAELAALRLSQAVDGPSAELEAARLDLWIRACDDQQFAGQGELLVELALERAESLAARGETEAALAATQELLVPARLAAQAGDLELRPADAAWLERAAAWLADPSLVALRTKLARPQDAPRASQDVEAVIREHLEAGNRQAVLQFGVRAYPVVAAYIESKSGEFPALADNDPLTLLFELDEERGARFALERLEQADDVFPLRVLRSMRAAKVLRNDGTWRDESQRKYGLSCTYLELLQPVWRDVLERLVVRNDTAGEAFEHVGLLVDVDALSPVLGAALESAIRGDDPARSQRALVALESAGVRASARDVLVRLLDHPRSEVRRFVAHRLALFDECRELWSLVADPDVGVRLAVLAGLSPRQRHVLTFAGLGNGQILRATEMTLRDLDRGGMAVLGELLQDSEPEVFLGALEVLRDNRDLSAPRETLRALARHEDARVRILLPQVLVDGVPDPIVLEILAGDLESSVLAQVDRALSELAAPGPLPTPERPLSQGQRVVLGMSTAWTDEFLPALLRRLDHPMGRFGIITGALVTAAHTRPGAVALAGRGTTTSSDDVANLVVDAFTAERPWDMGVSPWNLIEPDTSRALLARAWRSPPQAQQIQPTANELYSGPMAFRAAGARWLADAELPWSVRFLGAYVSAFDADDAWTENLLALLAQGEVATGSLAEQYGGGVAELARIVPAGELAGRLIAAAAARSDLPETFAIPLVEALAERAVLTPDQAEDVLERWAPVAHRYRKTVSRAIASVEATDEQPKLELFGRFLERDQVYHYDKVLEVMGRLHLRAHLPLLERTLLGEFATNETLRARQQIAAATALASYLDDEAAEILLRGVGSSTDPAVRDACFAALDTIRRYQDERARWNSRADAGRARAEAIAELVGLIEAGEAAQKVEAVRALGTLEALEELPRLVRLAGSKDAALAKAAKEALERIHAAGKRD